MEKYKICPECGLRNHPAAIECEQCGEDLSTVRILNEDTEEQLRAQKQHEGEEQQKTVTMVRVCEECGAKNDPQARKCVAHTGYKKSVRFGINGRRIYASNTGRK